MRKWWMQDMTGIGKLFLIAVLMVCTNSLAQQTDTVLVWNFTHPLSKEIVPAGTHGSVQEVLIAKGELPDPFYGKNELLFGWIEDHLWEFKSVFTVTDAMLEKDFLVLDFPGIDTYAEVFINDSMVGFAQNAFRPYQFNLKDLVKEGLNEVRLVFYSPVLFHKDSYKQKGYRLPAPNDVHEIAVAPYTRKPQYQFGWDWALRMNTIGLLKPVKLIAYDNARILGTSVQLVALEQEKAILEMKVRLENSSKSDLIWKSELFGEQILEAGTTMLVRQVELADPKLWWPRGQGEQYLYTDSWELRSSKTGALIEQKQVRFGVRKSVLVQESDKWGTSYEIHVNDRPIFCKGADYIPQDVFPSRVKDADLRKMVEQMVESNFNMVRVWGGGYYPDEAFFEACDELGIMVWQDFMFACAMYPGDPEFIQNVKEEAEYQVPRISSHPSVVLFNGNNEVDVAWKNWGFQLRYNIYGKDAKEIEDSYDRLFKQLLPDVVSSFSSLPYIHTSPLSNWGKDEFYNHGSQHYWGVWHGKDPMSDFAKKIGRFNAEYGFQSFPEFSTLSTFSSKEEWDVQSDVMKHHQKSYVGNLMILKHATNLFGKPADFMEFVYSSQLTQATAVRMAVTGHRLDRPRCMGTLYWQLNDCWPAPTWSSIDNNWNWKALQYWMKEDYADVAILQQEDSGKYSYFLSSDVIDTFMCEISYSVFDLNGKMLFDTNVGQVVRGVENSKLCMKNVEKNLAGKNCVIRFDWKNEKGVEMSRTFSQLPVAYQKANEKTVALRLESVDEERREVIIRVKNKDFLRNFWIYSKDAGLRFDRNFVDLLPGEHLIKIHYEGEVPTLSDFNMRWL
jgi:beta-mannosidase